ncbi:YhcU [Bacillus freudenreichii]|nr:YhcU [Bacillus freudenreichii]
MRVVFAASLEQKKMIKDLIDHLYHSVFPLYFDEVEIEELLRWEVLDTPSEKEEWLETANDAYRIIVALQVLILLLEVRSLPGENGDYQKIFCRNKGILEKYGLSFPFTYKQFSSLHNPGLAFSMFASPANEYLI